MIRLSSHSIVSSLIILLLYACGPSKPASTQVSTSSAIPMISFPSPRTTITASASRVIPSRTPALESSSTATITSSATRPVPSATSTLEPTPTLPLPAEGPYFAFWDGNLTLIGADNVGRKEIPLPAEARAGDCFACMISPDGRWLAYWTGFAGEVSYTSLPDPNGQYDLPLNLLHIPDGTTEMITNLLSPDYPANFQKNAQTIKKLPEFSEESVDGLAVMLYTSFISGIESAAWSPDSRFLAFAGEEDGPSSDLYVYDAVTKSILRLSDGSENIAWIKWSPDGKWIVYSSTYWVGEGTTVSLYAARPDDSQSRDFNVDVSGGFEGWVSPSVFLTIENGNGTGRYDLRKITIETGGASAIWQCEIDSYGYDPEQGSYLVQSYTTSLLENCQYDGLYFGIPSSTPARLLSLDSDGFPRIGFLGQGSRRFLIQTDSGAFVVSSTGKITSIGQAGFSSSISPDRQWVAFARKGLHLMDASGKISELLNDVEVFNVSWQPNSKGLFYTSGLNLFSISLPDGKIKQIEEPYRISNPDPRNIYWQPDSQGCFFASLDGLFFLSLPGQSATFIQDIGSPDSFDPAWVAVPK